MRFRRYLLGVALFLLPVVALAANPLEAGLSFQPMTINVGGTSSMSIEITNPNAIAATNLAAADIYPGGIINAALPNATTTCGGTLTAPAGSTSFTFSGGSLAANSTCVLTITIIGSQGLWVNALDPGSVTSSSVPANAFFSTALLIVNDAAPVKKAPGVSMTMSPAAIHAGKTTTLSIALKNPNGGAMTGVAFATEYPSALINTPEGGTSSCGGTVAAKPGSRTLEFSGGTIPANGTCTVNVVIRGSSPGTYTVALPAGSVTSSSHPASTQAASATVTVASSK
jgi:hypothetical protein